MRRLSIATAVFCAAASVYAADAKIGNLSIDDVWAKSGQPGQVSAAYMNIKNKGNADKIIAASCECAKATELHSMSMEGGNMKMLQVTSLEVPANGELQLKPSGYHIMLIDLKRPLVAGQLVPIKVKFEKAGEVTLQAQIKDKADNMMMH